MIYPKSVLLEEKYVGKRKKDYTPVKVEMYFDFLLNSHNGDGIGEKV